MKLYWCACLLAACSSLARGADATRPLFHIDTVAGSGRIGDGGPATAAQFSDMSGIAADRLGNLYVADTNNHRVRKVSLGGTVTTIAGTGIAGFSGDGGLAVNARLNLPYGLALDDFGNIYVADLGNERVRRIGSDGAIVTIAGNGRRASSPDGAGPLDTSLLSPRNIAIDGKGNLYIAEFEGHRVRRLSADGRLVTVAGTGIAGLGGDGFASVKAQVNYPAGLAFDRAGALYIADSGNNVVRKIFADGTIGTVLGRQGTQLFNPLGIAVDGAGTIYVGDSTFRVAAYTVAGKWLQYAGNGAPIFSGDGGPAKDAGLTSVNDLAVDVTGVLYIADGVRVRRVASTGSIDTVAGDGYAHSVGDGAAATSAILHQPSAIALDSKGNLYIADTGTQRVREVLPNGVMTTLAGTGVVGRDTGDAVPAGIAPLNSPMGLAVDGAGNVMVADAFNHRVVAINALHVLRPVAGTGTGGVSADGTAALSAALRGPKGVCLDRGGTLYIVDTSNHRVLRLAADGTVQTVAGNGSGGYAGDGGSARFAQLRVPGACAFDGKGNLYIADTGNHSIRKVTADGVISTVVGNGTVGASGDEGAAASARLASPRGLTVDDNGNLYIGDTGNNRVRQVTADGIMHTIAGTGPAGFAGDGGPAADAALDGPAGLFLDGSGALYFADSNNNRVRRLTPDVAVAPPAALVAAIAVVNGISLRPGPIAPGEIVSIFGGGLGPDVGVAAQFDAGGMLPTVLAGVEVRINQVSAPLFYAQSGQVNAEVPYAIAAGDPVAVTVVYGGKVTAAAKVQTAPSAPALLSLAVNQDGSSNAEMQAAARGAWMTFYATGEGLNDGAGVAGMAAQAPYAHPLLPVSLKIAGVDAEILFAGSAPGMVGVMQINARVPAGFVAPGAAKVELTVGDVTAPATTVWLR
uniref:NHL repeat containing protein n=1 Tax=Solibacter usitatus (strain Ellin6076) TaxID=234267 RepID=Q029Q7_SOLUE